MTEYKKKQKTKQQEQEQEEQRNDKKEPSVIPLLDELLDHNGFFDHIVDMIPSKLYIAGQSGDDYNPNTKYYKAQSKDSKETRKAQNKLAKRRKFDPAQAETTTKKIQNKLQQDYDNDTSDDDSDNDGGEDRGEEENDVAGQHIDDDDEDDNNKRNKNNNSKNKKNKHAVSRDDNNNKSNGSNGINGNNNNNGFKSRIEMLREKLNAKIAEKKGSRPTDPNVVSKRAARRAEKLRRREEGRNIKKKTPTTTKAGGITTVGGFRAGGSSVDDPTQDLATMDFGTLTGLNHDNSLSQALNSKFESNYMKTNKSLANLSKTKNLQKMLADAQEKKEKLDALRESKDEKDQMELSKIQWRDTIQEATGNRVKEDPAKIKKKIKQKEAKKKKSQKAWKSRLQEQQSKAKERQQIRNHNLGKRKLGGSVGSNLSKKEIKNNDATTEKKKRSRPGFEGRKEDFLNNKGKQ